jgi:hypothetical protein
VSRTANPIAETLALASVPDKSSLFPGGESQHHRAVTSDHVSICARDGQVGLPPVSEIVPSQPKDYILQTPCTRNARSVSEEIVQAGMQTHQLEAPKETPLQEKIPEIARRGATSLPRSTPAPTNVTHLSQYAANLGPSAEA